MGASRKIRRAKQKEEYRKFIKLFEDYKEVNGFHNMRTPTMKEFQKHRNSVKKKKYEETSATWDAPDLEWDDE